MHELAHLGRQIRPQLRQRRRQLSDVLGQHITDLFPVENALKKGLGERLGNDFWGDSYEEQGPPKRRVSDYPSLARIARGEADGVLVVRSPLFRRVCTAERLERLCPEGPSGWLTAAALEAAGLLPKPDRGYRQV